MEDNAFDGCTKLMVCATTGSYAAEFADSNGYQFERMGGVTASGKLIGDINGNTSVNIEDVTAMQQFLAEFSDGLDISDPDVIAYADVNGDGKVNIRDVTQIQRFLAEMIDTFV